MAHCDGTAQKIVCLTKYLNENTIETIEGKSSAVIEVAKYNSRNRYLYVVRGSKLAITLATTLLEEAQHVQEGVPDVYTTPLRQQPNKTSRRLSTVIQQSLKKTNQRGDYTKTTDAVKIAIASCLLNEVNTDIDIDENVNDKERLPSVVLIDDDDDDDVIVLDENGKSDNEDEDDDVLIIETPVYTWTPESKVKQLERQDVDDDVFDDVPMTPTADIDVDKVTKALEKLETPSAVKLGKATKVKPSIVVRPLRFHFDTAKDGKDSSAITSAEKENRDNGNGSIAKGKVSGEIKTADIKVGNDDICKQKSEQSKERKSKEKSKKRKRFSGDTDVQRQTKTKRRDNDDENAEKSKSDHEKSDNERREKRRKEKKKKNKKRKKSDSLRDKDTTSKKSDPDRNKSTTPYQFYGSDCVKDVAKMNLNFADKRSRGTQDPWQKLVDVSDGGSKSNTGGHREEYRDSRRAVGYETRSYPSRVPASRKGLRYIVVDGSNVAMR